MPHLLKEKPEYLDGVLKTMTVPCLLVDRGERLLFINRAYLDLYERAGEPGDYLGQTLGTFFYDDENQETITGRCMRENRAFRDLELASWTWSGRPIHVRYDVAPLFDPQGELIGAFAVIVDLTAIKEHENEIARLAAFPRSNPNPVISCDSRGALSYMNPAAVQLIASLELASPAEFLPAQHEEIVRVCLATGQGRAGVETSPGDRVFSWTYHPLPDSGVVHCYSLDITERKRMEMQLLHDAFHDALTGLPNRALFMDRLEQALRRARRDAQRRFAVLFLDLDRFKNVNDSLGHGVGDDLLRVVGQRMEKLLWPGDTLARLGGDEFALLLDGLAQDERAYVVAQALHTELARPFVVRGHELFVSVSVGIVIEAGHVDASAGLLRDADTAMYRAKALGRSQTVVFDQAMHQAAMDRLRLEMDLKRGLERDEFEPYYQPIVELATGRLEGFEALARWRHPERGLVAPGEFIPLAEETGLITQLGRTMLRRSCAQLAAWTRELPQARAPRLSVNLAVRQMAMDGIVEEIAGILSESGVSPASLKLEITESGVMEHVELALDVLRRLKALGLALCVDDFGTGYSSLSYLHRLPADFLKVDQSFVGAMDTNNESREIVSTILRLAHGLGKQVIAEGVETAAQWRILREMGCRYGQGYHFAKPAPATEAREMITRGGWM